MLLHLDSATLLLVAVFLMSLDLVPTSLHQASASGPFSTQVLRSRCASPIHVIRFTTRTASTSVVKIIFSISRPRAITIEVLQIQTIKQHRHAYRLRSSTPIPPFSILHQQTTLLRIRVHLTMFSSPAHKNFNNLKEEQNTRSLKLH
ncbi:hypothetical protein CLOM_g6464 [Closterium sp. NIES-68]|nr:hypothetical protein CLOM_g6464 [Closterium sp. NIES-68]GJP80082.1 hypothetical protein CLOP_g10316 [Closterium sp. NIES-67]